MNTFKVLSKDPIVMCGKESFSISARCSFNGLWKYFTSWNGSYKEDECRRRIEYICIMCKIPRHWQSAVWPAPMKLFPIVTAHVGDDRRYQSVKGYHNKSSLTNELYTSEYYMLSYTKHTSSSNSSIFSMSCAYSLTVVSGFTPLLAARNPSTISMWSSAFLNWWGSFTCVMIFFLISDVSETCKDAIILL